MKNMLIISDGIPGHFNQSKGVASILSKKHPSNISIIELSFKSHQFRRLITVLSRLLMKIPNRLTAKIISFFYSSINTNEIDLIIAAGGKTAPYSAALKILNDIPVIQLGSPRGLHSSLFNALVTVERYYEDSSNIIASITPNLYSPEVCTIAAKQKNLNEHILFLIGGEGIGYSYEDREWESLISAIKDLYNETHFPITVVTSRRSDPKVERKIKSELQEIPLDYSAWFHQGARNFNLAALFGAAKNIFVTEDSAMMISESISSGKPVTTLFPSGIKSPMRHKAHIQKYIDLNLITREPIEKFSIKEIENSSKNVQNHLSKLRDQLEEKIQW
jgi:mitochondrial fission protein ELM1